MRKPKVRSVFVGLVVSMMLMGAVAPMAAAAITPNQSADATQNPYIETDVTKDVHDMQAFGSGEQAVLTYYDDDGEIDTLPAELAGDDPNAVTYLPSHVSVSDYNQFPRSDEDVSAVDAGNWTATATDTGTADVADADLGDAEAVNVNANLADTETATFTFDEFTIDSDEEKRVLAIGGAVDEIGADAHVEIRAVDEDGDYKAFTANSSGDASTDTVWADSTGDSFISEARMGDLETMGTGTGDFNNIESIEVVVEDGNFDGTFSLINAEKMSTYDYGTQMVDENDDGDKDTQESVEQPNGPVSVTSLDTLGDTFNSATLSDIEFTAQFTAELADDDDSQANFTDATNYQTYDHIAEQHNRLSLVTAYDLAYSNSVLKDTVPMPEQRYMDAGYALGTGDMAFADLTDDDWTANTVDMYSGSDDVELATGIQPGETVIVFTESLITDDEKQDMEADEEAGGGGFFGSSGDGPIQKYVLSPIGGVVAAVLGFLGIKGRGE